MLTHIHGGPGATATNTFHPDRGKKFQKPKAIDKEPVEDVVTGIQHLISKGIAVKDQLGIMGHSHGGWLGPIVVAEYPHFQAASFSEGMADFLSLYGQMPGMLNLVTHEKEMSSINPYKNPERYLELSPAFRENFYKTAPTLLEYGQEKLAIQGLEMGKAFWRHETPYELVIYPDTGHNIFEPKMNVESMQRNLRWFEQWIEIKN